jgi:3-keto-5-aminohexanoate cleavage enzyme
MSLLAIRYTLKKPLHYLDMLPEGAMFSVLGIMDAELKIEVLSMRLGGDVRVGFEDNIHYREGVLAENNAQLVARIVRIGRQVCRLCGGMRRITANPLSRSSLSP